MQPRLSNDNKTQIDYILIKYLMNTAVIEKTVKAVLAATTLENQVTTLMAQTDDEIMQVSEWINNRAEGTAVQAQTKA
jgi:hypothetical protein